MGLVSRIWSKDETLWSKSVYEPNATSEGLGWLDLPAHLADLVGDARKLAMELQQTGMERVVLLGMGGSSMSAEALRTIFDIPVECLRIVDTLHTDTIADLVDLERTMFLVSSKSGSTRETLVLENHFRQLLGKHKVPNEIAQHFIAISDAGTDLAQRGHDKNLFKKVVLCHPNVGGRFSALSAFGILPFVLANGSADAFLQPIEHAVTQLQNEANDNEAVRLGQFFSNAIASKAENITILTSPRLNGFSTWAEQLLAESTGKNGTGLVPITGELLEQLELANYDKTRSIIVVRLQQDDNYELDERCTELQKRGFHLFKIDLTSVYEVGAQFLLWEFAIAVAGSLMKINPFDQPDVEIAKKRTEQILKNAQQVVEMPNAVPLSAIKRTIMDAINERDISYIALLAYLNPSNRMTQFFSQLRSTITQLTGLPTLFGYGPRYLHSTGQLLKGGPPKALVLGLWHPLDSKRDSNAVYAKLMNLMNAQGRADFEVMIERGQTVATMAVARDLETNTGKKHSLLNSLQ